MALHIVTSLQTIVITIVVTLFKSFKNKKERQLLLLQKLEKGKKIKTNTLQVAIKKSIILYRNIRKIYNLVELKYF